MDIKDLKLKYFTGKKFFMIAGWAMVGIILFWILWSSLEDDKAWRDAGAETGNIAIRVEAGLIYPFSILSIDVRNIQTEGAATSVIFTRQDGVTTMTIPAIEVTDEQIKVPVPPLFDKDGNFVSDDEVVSLKVIQVQRLEDSQVLTRISNEITVGGMVLTMPELDSDLPKGKLSGAFVAATLDSIDERLTAASPKDAEFYQALTKSRADFEDLLQKINEIVKDPANKIKLKTISGAIVTITADDLAKLDRMFWGFLTEFEKAGGSLSLDNYFGLVKPVYAGTACQAYQDIPEFGAILSRPCQHQESVAAQGQKVGNLLPEAAQLAWSPALIMVGGAVGELGTAAGLSTINQIGLSVAFSTAMDVLIQGGTTLQNVATNILTTIGDKALDIPAVDPLGLIVPTATFCQHVYEAMLPPESRAGAVSNPGVIFSAPNAKTPSVRFIETGKGAKVSTIPVSGTSRGEIIDEQKPVDIKNTKPVSPKPIPVPAPKPEPTPVPEPEPEPYIPEPEPIIPEPTYPAPEPTPPTPPAPVVPVQPKCVAPYLPFCNVVSVADGGCAGLPSYPTFQYEDCLTKCVDENNRKQYEYNQCLMGSQ